MLSFLSARVTKDADRTRMECALSTRSLPRFGNVLPRLTTTMTVMETSKWFFFLFVIPTRFFLFADEYWGKIAQLRLAMIIMGVLLELNRVKPLISHARRLRGGRWKDIDGNSFIMEG